MCEHWLSCLFATCLTCHHFPTPRTAQNHTWWRRRTLWQRHAEQREREREEGELRAPSCTHNLNKISAKISVVVFLYWVSVFVFYCCFFVFLFFSPFSWFWNLLQWSFVFTEVSEIQSFALVSQLPRFCSLRIRTSLCLEFRSRDSCACLCLRVECVCVHGSLFVCVCVYMCVRVFIRGWV